MKNMDNKNLTSIENRLYSWMRNNGSMLQRVAIGIVFLWFGIKKPLGISPVNDLVAKTVFFLPPEFFIPFLGIWEVAIGICFIYRPWLRYGLWLFFPHMLGTVLPLLYLHDETFTMFPFALTVVGQYIIKNMVLIAGAFIVAGTLLVEKHDKNV